MKGDSELIQRETYRDRERETKGKRKEADGKDGRERGRKGRKQEKKMKGGNMK